MGLFWSLIDMSVDLNGGLHAVIKESIGPIGCYASRLMAGSMREKLQTPIVRLNA